jgi:hypothetical protein
MLRELTGHDVTTVGELGSPLDVLSFATLILRARSNRLADLTPLVPALLRALDRVRPGQVIDISASSK